MKNDVDHINRILKIWEEREDTLLSFSQIFNELKKEGWYTKKVDRYLTKMVKAELLKKEKIGIKGARANYKPSELSHEFFAYSVFKHIRESTQKTGLLYRENESFLVYGIPPKGKLTSLEKDILDLNLNCINEAFYNLYLLKHSISAREKADQPLDHRLLWYYLLQKVSNRAKDRMYHQVQLAKDYNDIERTLELAREINIEVEGAEKLLEIEKRWLDFNNPPPIHDKGLWDSFDEACLSVLIMRRPEDIEKYGLSLYFLNKLIKDYEDEHDLGDKSLFYLAETFYRTTRFRKASWILEDIYKIRNWLKWRIGSKKGEKLARCIHYFWKNYYIPWKELLKNPETNKQYKKENIKVTNEEKNEWRKAINFKITL